MTAITSVPGLLTPSKRHIPYNDEGEIMSTIPDPRSRTMLPADGTPPSPSHHPDLSNEVATLSNKLINAINHQTNLDDTLSATRHELNTACERIRQLELEINDHENRIAGGLLIASNVVQAERINLLASAADEKKHRVEVEKEKKQIEQELENLTQALFEEANKMVVSAREAASKDHELVQRRNDQLKTQLADTENLLKSHQEQLAELKYVIEQMSRGREEPGNSTAPSTPGTSKFETKEEMSQGPDRFPTAAGSISPSHPTSFTHLLHPVLRTDLSAFDDFTSLLRVSKTHVSGSRVSSGSYGSISANLGLGVSSNGSTSSLGTSVATGSSPGTPTTPASTVSTSSMNGANNLVPLKETRFYKRALAEDIEPTLRLDTAPGLSWLARRGVLNSMCEGTLVVEPMPVTSTSKFYVYACSLCGETRKDASHVRSHRFRTSESDSAQRYPLCKYCLGRVRSSCDFLGFLRVLKDGHWRTDDEESERVAWEESVRLREQMFWCRIGGGVVPVNGAQHQTEIRVKTPRLSEDGRKEMETMKELSGEATTPGGIDPEDTTLPAEGNKTTDLENQEILMERRSKRPSVHCDSAEGSREVAQEHVLQSITESAVKCIANPAGQDASMIRASDNDSSCSLAIGADAIEEENRLSITIPGSFE